MAGCHKVIGNYDRELISRPRFDAVSLIVQLRMEMIQALLYVPVI